MTTQSTVILASLLALLVATACERKAPPPQEEVIRPVRTETVLVGGSHATRSFSGIVKAGTETKLSFKVGGTLTALKPKVGDQLKRGDLVATLEAQDQALQVQSARANVAQVEAQLRNAQAQYERVKSLYANNNSTQSELDTTRTAYESARATLAAAKKQLELTQSQAGKTVLRAPLAGQVARVDVELGENVAPGQTVVMLNSGSKAEVEIAVPETLIALIETGQKAHVAVAALGGRVFEATVTEVGVTTGRTATTYQVVCTLENEEENIRSGMAAEVVIELSADELTGKLLVNPKAVGEDRNGRFVYLVNPTADGFATVERRAVQVGDIGTQGMVVLDGLQRGDVVVTAGLTYLVDGKRVRLPNAATASPTTPVPSASGPPTATAGSDQAINEAPAPPR